MADPLPVRNLERLKWTGVLVPIALIWVWEVVRFVHVDGTVPSLDEHILSALVMAGGIVLFGMLMAVLIERTQQEILRQNRDLTALAVVGAAVRGSTSLERMAGQALDRLIEQTGALGGRIEIGGPDGSPIVVSRPQPCPAGLAWVMALLDEPGPTPRGITYTDRNDLETLILDVGFDPRLAESDRIRLILHPPVRPNISDFVLEQLAREIATTLHVEHLVADLRRREHEQSVLYELALQLTERAETQVVLDRITAYTRDLISADRAVICLVDPTRPVPLTARRSERLAIADDGTVCLLAHAGDGPRHERNPLCQVQPGSAGTAWISRPLRGPGELLGELCATRSREQPFTEAEGTLLGALADMAAVAVRASRLHDAEEQMTILSERDRIARELHDSLAQVLGQIHLQLRGLEARTDGAAISGDLAAVAEIADEAYRDVREAILGLRESIPADGGLESALRAYLAKYTRQTGIAAHLECDGQVGRALSPKAEVQLLRVVQEALTNVRKHAGASEVRVVLQARDGVPTLSVIDDGSGFDATTVGPSLSGGFGLRSMRERVELLGGTLNVQTAPRTGTRIIATLVPEAPHVAPAATSPAPR